MAEYAMAKTLTVLLHTDEMIALRRAARERVDEDLEATAALLLRDALIAGGWLEDAYQLEEDTETAGEA